MALANAETLIEGLSLGDSAARERALSHYYDDFRAIARGVLRGEGSALMIQPTELAHEAVLRFLGRGDLAIKDRTHFLALTAHMMRCLVIDEVRRLKALKRRPPSIFTVWSDRPQDTSPLDLEAFDDALTRLRDIDPERAKIVELRFYAGLTLEEIASHLGQSLSTVKRRWTSARAWLLAQLTPGKGTDA
jgi:RNA polymerase sigma factor (TIGR02999 family)